jgi:cellulose synthase/poly-beta-1,6-N-acetylglucosamine synthase-like glycosyltransferase
VSDERSDVASSPRDVEGNRRGVAVLLPCYNEEATIGRVIDDVHASCRGAEIVVFHNNSTDRSAAIAKEMNVRVVRVSRQGKGKVVRAMFKRVEADIYVMLDADASYPADRIPDLIKPVLDGTSDVVVGARLGSPEAGVSITPATSSSASSSASSGARASPTSSRATGPNRRGRTHPARRLERL